MAETSHTGRGGAGNVGTKSPPPDEAAFHTPTIKQAHYTTGRGGSGNLVKNENPDNARKAQDVDAPLAAAKDLPGPHHVGRGGGGNFIKDNEAAPANGAAAVEENGHANGNGNGNGRVASAVKPEKTARRGSGVLDRAKETLGLKKADK